MHLPTPLLTGAAAFRADAPRPVEAWTGAFLAALRRGRGRIYAAAPPRVPMVHRAVGDQRPAARFSCRGRGRHYGGGPYRLRDVARRRPRHRGQEHHSTARRVCCPRHSDRSHASLQAPPLWPQASGTVTCGSEAAAPCPQHRGVGTPGKGRGRGGRYAGRGGICRRKRRGAGATPVARADTARPQRI